MEKITKSQKAVANALLEGDVAVNEMAKRANVSVTTVYRYLKDDKFKEYLNGLIEEEIKRSEASIWRKLLSMCESGDLHAIKLYFELSGKNKSAENKSGVNIIDDVPYLCADDIEKLYGELCGI